MKTNPRATAMDTQQTGASIARSAKHLRGVVGVGVILAGLLVAGMGCGANADAAGDDPASSVAALTDGTFTGALSVSTTDATVRPSP